MYNRFNIFATTPDETPEPDTPETASQPSLADIRAAAAPLRAVTRGSRAASSSSEGHLRAPTPAELIRSIARSRTPSPSPTTASTNHFNFPEASTADRMAEDDTRRLIAEAVDYALKKDREERDKQSALHTEAAVAAALANQTSHVRSLRKPDLPNLDKLHIDSWIRRIEHAFNRAEVHRPKDKLSFLESKFSGCDDATINEFLAKDSQEDWDNFLHYLRDIYGKTTRERVNHVFNGVAREGRRPKQFAAHIRELTGKITLDDVYKELMLKDIPQEVRRQAAVSIKNLNFEETADHLDQYFDKRGKVLDAPHATTNSVNSVKQQQQPQQARQPKSSMKHESPSRGASAPSSCGSEAPSFTSAFNDAEDDSGDVNAVRFRPNGQRQSFNVNNGSQSRTRGRQNGNSSGNGSSRGFEGHGRSSSRYNSSSGNDSSNYNSREAAPTRQNGKLCSFHVSYGDKARSCKEGCLMFAQHQSKGKASN